EVVWVAFRIGLPEGVSRSGAALQWIPAHRAFDQSDRRQHEEENDREDDAARDVRHSFRKLHPELSWNNEQTRRNHAKQNERRASDDDDISGVEKLSTIKPPRSEQHKNAAHDQPKLFLCSEATWHQLLASALTGVFRFSSSPAIQ